MPRQASGSFDTIKLEDGTRAFRLRFPAAGKRQRMVLHNARAASAVAVEAGPSVRRVPSSAVTPDLADVLTAHLRRVKAAGYPSGPDAHLFPNHRGGRMTRQRVGAILHEAQALATERIEAKGRPPMPTLSEVARPGLEPGTPRFSVVGQRCLENSRNTCISRRFSRPSCAYVHPRKLRPFPAGLGTEMRAGA